MKTNSRVILFLLVVLPGFSFADQRKFPYADAVPFLGMESIVKVVKRCAFAVQIPGNQRNENTKDDWISLGSGFLIRKNNGTIVGVTCRHVVTAATNKKKPVFLGLDTDKGYRRFRCEIAYTDPNNDIAVVKPQKPPAEDVKLEQLYFTKEIFGDNSSLVEGRGVIIPGYPLSLGIEDDKNHPVVRFGIIAQFTGKKIFLIYGVASHGNRGSPVFALKYAQRELIGMITSHIADNITLFDERGQVRMKLPYNSGLARAMSMEVIVDAVQEAN